MYATLTVPVCCNRTCMLCNASHSCVESVSCTLHLAYLYVVTVPVCCVMHLIAVCGYMYTALSYSSCNKITFSHFPRSEHLHVLHCCDKRCHMGTPWHPWVPFCTHLNICMYEELRSERRSCCGRRSSVLLYRLK